MKEMDYQCGFCGKRFASETRYMKHECKQMKRDEQFRSPIGQAAWSYYQEWMKQYRRQIPPSKTFLSSKFYNSFIRFAKFVKQTSLPTPKTFIWLMKEKDIAPVLWTSDEVYSMYVEFLDRQGDPMQQVQTTVNTIFDISEAAECGTEDIFNILTGQEVIQLIRQRRLSPWFLLHCNSFFSFLEEKVTPEEYTIINTIVRPDYWKEKFKQYENIREQIKKIVQSLGLHRL